MTIIYSDNKEPWTQKSPPNLANAKATEKWLEHFSNSIILTKIQQNPKDLRERIQATKELAICERKMKFWERHPNFNLRAATNEANQLKALWEVSQNTKK